MTEEEKRRAEEKEINFLPVIEGEIVEPPPMVVNVTEEDTVVRKKSRIVKHDDNEEETVLPAKKRIGPKVEIAIQNPKSQIQNSLDDPICSGQNGGRNGKVDLFGSFQVDDQIEL